jgi:hypothetical protein
MTYGIPVICEIWGLVYVDAPTLEEAVSLVKNSQLRPEDKHTQPIDGSTTIDYEGLDALNWKSEKEQDS